MSRNSLLAFVFLAGAAIGWATLPHLDHAMVLAAVFVLMVVSIVLGWVIAIQNRALRVRGWFAWGGVIQPVIQRWFAPMQARWPLILLALFVGLIAGASIHVLFLAGV